MPAVASATRTRAMTTLRMLSALPDPRNARRRAAHALHALELDQRALVIENRAQLAVAGVGEIALELDDLIVGGHAHFELAGLGFELLLGKLAREAGRFEALQRALDAQRRVGDFDGDLQLARAHLRLRLLV